MPETFAVLADDARVYVARIHAEVLAQDVLEARGVEHGARPDHAVLRHARQLERHVRENVHRVRHHQQDALVVALRDLGDDGLEDAHVLVHEVEARLAGLLVRAGRDDDDGRVGRVVVVARVDVHGAGEGHAVRDVERLALRAVAVDVDEHHLGEQLALHERERRGGSHEPASDDGDLPVVGSFGHVKPFPSVTVAYWLEPTATTRRRQGLKDFARVSPFGKVMAIGMMRHRFPY